jgi:hypothetical protein
MLFNQLPGYVQPQTAARLLGIRVVVNLVKAGEYVLQVRFRDTDARIRYSGDDVPGVNNLTGDADGTVLRRKFNGIADYVSENLLQLVGVP